MFRRILALILKELQALLKDPQSRRLVFLPVILQVALFPFAATLEVKNTTLAIYNQDSGVHSTELLQRFAKAQAFPHLINVHSPAQVQRVIGNQEAMLVISIPSDFSRNISSQKQANLQIILDGRRSNSAQIALSYIQEIVQNYKNELQGPSANQAFMLRVRHWFNPNLQDRWYVLPSLIAIITTLGSLIVTALSVAREREQGTFEQLLISPLTPGYLMIGKTIPALIIALLQASIILFASIFFYRIPFQGSLVLLYFCLVCYALSLAGIGLFISSISNTQQQAFLGVFGFLMPAILLSGFVAPIENIPEPLQTLTWFDPIRHFLIICKGIYLKGFDFSFVWPNLWPLLIIALMTLSLAYVMFKRYTT